MEKNHCQEPVQLIQAPSLWSLLESRADLSPKAVFLIQGETDRVITFGECRRQALDLAAWLYSQGIGPGTVVAWQLPTRIESVLLQFALARLGAIQAPVIHLYGEKELAQVLTQAGADFVIVPPGDEEHRTRAQLAVASLPETAVPPRILALETGGGESQLPPFAEPGEAVHWYYFTSGTTSRPKGARHTDQTLMAGARYLGTALEVRAVDVGTIGYPIGHIGGIIYSAMAIMAGIPVVLIERYVPARVAAAFRRHRVTLGGGSTAHYQMLLAEQARVGNEPLIPSLEILAGGGAAKPADLFGEVRNRLDATIVHAYGMTEAPISAHNSRYGTDEQLTHSDGIPMPGLEVRIVDGQGRVLATGESGEILLRGPNVCKGYLDPEQTAAAFDEEGFLHTGDVGHLREDGHLCVTGRIKDIIIRKGENISAREIEESLLDHPKVGDVAVIGLPDPERGEMVCAVVEPVDINDPLTFGEMLDHLSARKLMRQKIPERLENLERLPRNEGLQKVVKTRLRDRFMAG